MDHFKSIEEARQGLMALVREGHEAVINHEQVAEFEQKITDFITSVWESAQEDATHCTKLVENGKAICGCKLDCHIHDWRADRDCRTCGTPLSNDCEECKRDRAS